MLKHLNHPNIATFKGVTFEPLQIVAEWIDGGHLLQYLRTNPDVDLIKLVSIFHLHWPQNTTSPHHQSFGIANGLFYLHSCDVIHGDLKGVCGAAYINKSMLMVVGAAKHTNRYKWEAANCRLWLRSSRTRYKLARRYPRQLE